VSAADDLTELYRERIWRELQQVARPDSRFHWDFSRFIADFEGSDLCAQRVLALAALRDLGDSRIFVTPDNCLEPLRAELIRRGQPFVMSTYGIVRGFLALDPADVPAGEARYAATLDGFDRYARPVLLAELARGRPFGLLVTGGSAVSRNGVRFGKGHGYFDFEFAVLSELGLVTDTAVVVDVVHDCQYVDDDLAAEAHDVPVDLVVTPTRTLRVEGPPRAPGRVHWELLPGTEFDDLEIVAELRSLDRPSTPTI
jgi:5-formyltetrahydrofolate cyclo-ligase